MNTKRIQLSICMGAMVSCASASAMTRYVKVVDGAGTGDCSTWQTACTMAHALEVAVSGDEIWAKKTYPGPAYPAIGQIPYGVKIFGGFGGTETLASQSNPWTKKTVIDGNGERCAVADGNGDSTVLRGFHFTNCAYLDSEDWQVGGGALALRGSSMIIVNCVFENSSSVRVGGAVGIDGGSPKFFNCIFRSNGTGTAGSAADSNVQPIAGGAVYVHSGTPSFTNCLFHGNKSAEGGALANLGGRPVLTNCTISDNYAKFAYGGGINDGGGRTVLRNCIVWGNTAIKGGSQIFSLASTPASVATSNVQGGWTGTGNLNVDPLFVNPAAGDYKLQATTPCDNVGGGALPADVGNLDWDLDTDEPVPLDLAGGARVNVIIDMGAYEIQAGGGGDD